MKERVIIPILLVITVVGAIVSAVVLPREELPAPEEAVATNPPAAPIEPAAPTEPATPIEPASTPAAPPAEPVGRGAEGTPLTVTGQLSHPWVKSGLTNAPMYVQIDVDAIEHEGNRAVPMDIAIVIDRSGSMSGKKLADARTAALNFVDRLDADDRVAVISYHHTARVDVTFTQLDSTDDRESVNRAIRGLKSTGGTNIHMALDEAQQLFTASSDAGRVRRVVLLSDGRAGHQRECEQLADTMRQGGVSVTTMGLGADYDEKMLSAIADHGAGNYYFIADAENLATTFDRELSSLTRVVADNAVVKLQLAEGVALKTLHGFPYTRDGQSVYVPLALFWSKRNASILAELSVDTRHEATFPIVDIDLTYRDLVNSTDNRHALHLTAAPTHEGERVETARNGEVFVRYEKIANANAYEEAMQELEAGNIGNAQQILKQRRVQLEERQRELSNANFADNKAGLLNSLADDARAADKDADTAAAQPAAPAPTRSNWIKGNRAKGRDMLQTF